MDLEIIISIVIIILSAVIITAMAVAVKKHFRGKEEAIISNSFVVTQPKIKAWLGIICLLIFVFLTAVSDTDTFAENLAIGSIFGLLGVILVIYSVRWKIKIENETICFTPFIGKQKRITFSDITDISLDSKQKPVGVTVYTNKGAFFSLSIYYTGYEMLIERLQNQGLIYNKERFLGGK